MEKPTKKQREVLDFIRNAVDSGCPTPSVREMQDHFGLRSTRAVCDRLDALEKKGLIHRDTGKARSIRVTGKSPEKRASSTIPMLGRIPAGVAVDANQVTDRTIHVDVETLGFIPSAKTFALVVHGDSMKGRGVLDGDCVIVDGKREARNGDMVAALIDQECTLKTLVKDKTGTFLKPENPAYGNLWPVNDLQIQGVVRTLIRTIV